MLNNSDSKKSKPLALDVMGSDLGPEPLIDGAIEALRELGIHSILVGHEDRIRAYLKQKNLDKDSRISIVHASEVVEMDDSPAKALRTKQDSSIFKAFELVKQGHASGVISAGNTGAMMAAGMLSVGTLPGVARPAIATLIPKVGSASPTVLLDSGANVDCHAQQLVHFALMGDFYAKAAIGCLKPRIGLLSNGSEPSKGNDILRATALTLKSYPGINYIGYVEGRDIPRDLVDVIVCDGFVGNVVLKTMEGAVELVVDSIKVATEGAWRAKLGMFLSRPMLRSMFREKLDPSAYGGAPLLGLSELAIVCHGSSSARAIKNALRVSDKLNKAGLIETMRTALSDLDARSQQSFEDGMWNRLETHLDKRKSKKKDREDLKETRENKEGVIEDDNNSENLE